MKLIYCLFVFGLAIASGRAAEQTGNRDTPAHIAARNFQRGVNLGNYLEAPPQQNWGAKYTEDDFKHIQAEGFDHVRLPIAWHHYAGDGPEHALSQSIYAKADFLVTNALKHRLNVIVNLHHFDAFTSDPNGQKARFLALWKQIAKHYANAPEAVAFELLNEPKDAATTVVMNPIYAEAIKVIRQSNPTRAIFVGPGRWNQVSELKHLQLPPDDKNLIVTVHCYDPFYFTHQGASWTGADTKVMGIKFPGPPETPLQPDPGLKLKSHVLDWFKRYNTLPSDQNPSSPKAFREKIQVAQNWSKEHGRPVHMGEFGAYIKADSESRATFYREFRKALAEAEMGWAMWDWKAGFRYWDDKTGKPAAGMREAIFGKK